MTERLPAPFVLPEVDLRDFRFTPMFRARLFGSSFHARVSDSAWRAGVTLWLKSWDQVPAGSLPDDDVDLCRLAELGRDLKAWKRLRAEAMWGWVKCSDGRFYHEVVAEGVNEAWAGKCAQRVRTEAARAARAAKRQQQTNDEDVTEPPERHTSSVTGEPISVTDTVTGSKGQGQGQGQGDSSTEASASSADPAQHPLPVVDPKRVVFRECLAWLKAASGGTDRTCRTLIGRWCRDHGDAAVIQAFQTASRDPPAGDPVAWLEGILKRGKTNGAGRGDHQPLLGEGLIAAWGGVAHSDGQG